MIKGVIRLTDAYSRHVINLACEKALAEAKHNYQYVRIVLAKKLYLKESPTLPHPKGIGGFYHELEVYERLAAACMVNN